MKNLVETLRNTYQNAGNKWDKLEREAEDAFKESIKAIKEENKTALGKALVRYKEAKSEMNINEAIMQTLVNIAIDQQIPTEKIMK